MFIKVTEKESRNRILINTDHIVSIIECDDFGYTRILLDVDNPDYVLKETKKPIIYDVVESNLAELKAWEF